MADALSPATATRPDWLARFDAVAAEWTRRATPVRFALAANEDERTAIYRLRHRVVSERGWATATEPAAGIERDAWDDVAVHMAGWRGDEAIACARLVFPAVGRRLPAEEVFDVTIPPVGRVVHIDRLVVARPVSDPAHRVLLGLVGRCWLETHARGCVVWAGIDSRLTTRLYRALGFDVRVVGPGRTYWNEERFPVRLDVASGAEAIVARWEARKTDAAARPPES